MDAHTEWSLFMRDGSSFRKLLYIAAKLQPPRSLLLESALWNSKKDNVKMDGEKRDAGSCKVILSI
jgi:hypothetical protein